jgi:cell shape-determining protein MreD
MKRVRTFVWLGIGFLIERVFSLPFFPALLFITSSNIAGIHTIWLAMIFGMVYDIISTLPFGFYSISLVTATVLQSWISSRLYEHQRSSRIIGASIGVVGYTLVRFAEFSLLHRENIIRQLTQECIIQLLIVGLVIGVLEKFVRTQR